jgi:hypothetical protein
MGLVEEGFSQSEEITLPTSQADDFIEAGSCFAKLGKKATKAECCELSFERVRGDDEVSFCSADHSQHAT